MFNDLDILVQECKELLGINYHILVVEPISAFKEKINTKEVDEAGSIANTILYSIKRMSYFELHKNMGHAFIEILSNAGGSKYIASIHMQLAISYDMEKDFASAEKHFHEGVKYATPMAEKGDKEAILFLASLWYNRSQQSRNNETAQEKRQYAETALKFYEQINDKRGALLSLNCIGEYTEKRAYKERMYFYKRAEEEAIKMEDLGITELVRFNMGKCEVENGNYELGIKMMESSAIQFEKLVSGRYAALAKLDLAEAYIQSGDLAKAGRVLDFAEKIFLRDGITVYNEKLKYIRTKIVQQNDSR